MIDSKEINKFAFPLVLTNIGQVIIGQIALHFAVNNSSIALSGISIIQNLLFAFGGLLGAFSLSFNIKSSKAYSNRQTNRFDDLLKSNLTLDLIIGVAFAVFVIIFGNVILKQLYGFKGQLLSLSTIYLVFIYRIDIIKLFADKFIKSSKENKTNYVGWTYQFINRCCVKLCTGTTNRN